MTGRRATGDKPHATIELNIQFVGGVQVGEFVEAHCEVVRETRSVLFIESKLKVGAQRRRDGERHLEDFGGAVDLSSSREGSMQ